MKQALILFSFLFSISLSFGQSSPNNPSAEISKIPDKVFVEMSEKLCGCVNKAAGDMSLEFKQLIIENSPDTEKLMNAIQAYAVDNFAQAEKDIEILQQMASDKKLKKCLNKIDKENEKYYTAETQTEFLSRSALFLSKIRECKFAYAFYTIGNQMEE